jgi:hypothetical protein
VTIDKIEFGGELSVACVIRLEITLIIIFVEASNDSRHLNSVHLWHVDICEDERIVFVASKFMQLLEPLFYFFDALRTRISLLIIIK